MSSSQAITALFADSDDEGHTPGTGTNQGTNLPTKIDEKIEGIDKLTGRDNFDSWETRVLWKFDDLGLKRLLNKSIPRPGITDPNFGSWKKLTKKMRTWLSLQIDDSIIDDLKQSGKTLKYCDETYEAIKQIVTGTGENLEIDAFLSAVRIQRKDFATIPQFIAELKKRVQYSNSLDMKLTPYMSTGLLLANLQRELPSFVEIKRSEVARDKGKDMTHEQYLTTCNQALDRARELESSQAFAAPTKSSSSQPRQKKQQEKRNSPAPGVSHDDHVKQCLAKPCHNGRCGHCNRIHDTNNCHCLRPDLRPPHWEPPKNIWAYKPREKGKKDNSPKRESAHSATAHNPCANLPEEENFTAFGNVAIAYHEPPNEPQCFSNLAIPHSIVNRTRTPWMADTGCSHTIVTDPKDLIFYEQSKTNGYRYETSNGKVCTAQGRGKAIIRFLLPNGQYNELKTDCLYQSGLSTNLLAIEAAKEDFNIFYDGLANIRRLGDKSIVGYTYTENRVAMIYTVPHPSVKLDVEPPDPRPYRIMGAISMEKIHRRLAHCNLKFLKESKQFMLTAEDTVDHKSFNCHPCKLGKSKRLVSHVNQPRALKVMELIHIDVQECTPLGRGSKRYSLILVDDYSRCTFAKHMQKRSDASKILEQLWNTWYNVANRYPQRVRSDDTKDFNAFINWVKEQSIGTVFEPTPPRAPDMNPTSERFGGYVMQIARTLINDSTLPHFLWPYAVDTTVHVINRLLRPNRAEPPIRLWREGLGVTNPPNDLSHLRIWGCKAFVHIPKEDRVQSRKMAPRAEEGRLIGYEGNHIYQVYMKNGKVIRSRDVAFDEDDTEEGTLVGSSKPKGPTNPQGRSISIHVDNSSQPGGQIEEQYTTGRIQTLSPSPDVQLQIGNKPAESQESMKEVLSKANKPSSPNSDCSEDPLLAGEEFITPRRDPSPTPSAGPRRSTRSNKGTFSKPRYGDEVEAQSRGRRGYDGADEEVDSYGLCMAATTLKTYDVEVPSNLRQAQESQHWRQWKEAMDSQIGKLEAIPTWEEVQRPPGQFILPGKWVYDIKSDQDNNIQQFRARWVVCGNRQRPGLEYDKTSSPVISESACKLFMVMVAKKGLYCSQFDVITAYLNAHLRDLRIFMMYPTGYGKDPKTVCLLLRALYGLKQSGYLWYVLFKKKLISMGFESMLEEPCLFINTALQIHIILYVDDALIASDSAAKISQFYESIKTSFPIKIIGEPNRFLGCDINREGPHMTLDQTAYIKSFLHAIGMQDCNPVSIPMNTGWKPDDSRLLTESGKRDFLSDTGSINWMSTRTRPDVQTALSKLQRRSQIANKNDYAALHHLVRYLKGSIDKKLHITGDGSLAGYVDASHADCEQGKSTEGFIFLYGSTPISWSSKRQKQVASSSTEAEFIAVHDAAKEAIWLAKLLNAMDLRQSGPIPIYIDSANAYTAIMEGTKTSLIRWIEIKYWFAKQAVDEGHIKLFRIAGSNNPADAMTKALPAPKLKQFLAAIDLK